MREWLIERIEIPNRTVLNRKIPKKAFFTQADLSASEKEMFTSQIEGIHLISVMNQQSMNIPIYKTEEIHYAEVVWVYVQLRKTQNIGRIVNAVHKSIPNPVLLILESPNKEILFSTCHKRLNKSDASKVVIDQPIVTKWFQPNEEETVYNKLLEALDISKLAYDNLFSFYDDIHQWLKCEELLRLIGTMPITVENREKVIYHINQMHEDQKEMERLQLDQNNQLDFGAKMDFHLKIKRLEQQMSGLLQQMKELC